MHSKIDFTTSYIAGIDEAGRGPLAGPVAVGAVKIHHKNVEEVAAIFADVKDSKKLSRQKREGWFALMQEARVKGLLEFSVSLVGPRTIDTTGIRPSIARGIRLTLKRVHAGYTDTHILLDGGLKAPRRYQSQQTIVGGDGKEMTIAMASIAAKVIRDRRMEQLALRYPEYIFEEHKGYGTTEHYKRIKTYGVTEIHRKTFLKKLGTLQEYSSVVK